MAEPSETVGEGYRLQFCCLVGPRARIFGEEKINLKFSTAREPAIPPEVRVKVNVLSLLNTEYTLEAKEFFLEIRENA